MVPKTGKNQVLDPASGLFWLVTKPALALIFKFLHVRDMAAVYNWVLAKVSLKQPDSFTEN